MALMKLLQNKAISHFTCSAPFCQPTSLLSIQLTVNLKVSSILGLGWNFLRIFCTKYAGFNWQNQLLCYCTYFQQVYQEEINSLGNLIIYAKYQFLRPSAMSFTAHCSGWVFDSAQCILEDFPLGYFCFGLSLISCKISNSNRILKALLPAFLKCSIHCLAVTYQKRKRYSSSETRKNKYCKNKV